jgi:4-hydroxy-3-methylbut-2-enyl diphosphate reductase
LREIAADAGVRAHLIDGADDLRAEWFEPNDVVLVTAGASAPETVVNECLDWLVAQFQATLEPRIVRAEEVRFPLPKTLRQIDSVAGASNTNNEPT